MHETVGLEGEMGSRFPFGVMGMFWNGIEAVAAHTMNVLDASELFKTVNFMLCEFHFNKKKMAGENKIFLNDVKRWGEPGAAFAHQTYS